MLYVRRDSDDVLELLTKLVENTSSDSEAEDLEMLRFLSAFGSTKEKGERLGIEKCDMPGARVSTALPAYQRQARHVWMGSRDAPHGPTFTRNGKLNFSNITARGEVLPRAV